MTLLTSAQLARRSPRERRRGHRLPIIICGGLLAAAAIAAVAYLLWPTWRAEDASAPAHIPVSIANTLFNVPTKAFRIKLQQHSGPQERVDLNFDYPSLEAPAHARHVSSDNVGEAPQPIDRIFLSIAAHHDALSPEQRLRTIYPRYLSPAPPVVQDGLVTRAFKDGSPYGNEDLFSASEPMLVTRCTRDGITPGMCLSERRIQGADLIFRFPRQWLAQWRQVAGAMERLTAQLYGTGK